MSGTPSGTVTFLFTDIEGSTRLWQDHPGEMSLALATHDDIVRSAVGLNHGYIFATGGDSFCAAFDDPSAAAAAAMAIRDGIDHAAWGDLGRLKVKMALDTGHADERDGGYFGMPLNRAARIRDQAEGTAILCSATTADLLRDDPTFRHRLDRVGRRRLRNLDGPETIFRISDRQSPGVGAPSVTRGVVAVAGLVVLTLSWLIPDEADEPVSSTPPPKTTTTTTTGALPADPPVWSIDVGDVTAGPMILGDGVFVGTPDGVVAIELDSGEPRWFSPTSRPAEALDNDGEFVFVTTRQRLHVLHPSRGDAVPRCGFRLPVALARTAVARGDVFVMAGSLLRIETNPRDADCHREVVENATTAGGLAPVVGPIETEHLIVVADGTGLYAFDPATLQLVWQYPDGQGPVLSVHDPALAAAEIDQRYSTSVRHEVLVATADTAGILSLVRVDDDGPHLVPIEPTRIDPAMPILVTDHAVIAVDASGRVVGLDPETGAGVWRRDDIEVTGGPIASDGWVFVAGPLGVDQIDPIDGTTITVRRLGFEPRRLVVRSNEAILVDSDDVIHAIELPFDSEAEVWRPPPNRRSRDPETVAREFLGAWTSGDRQTVEQLLGPDAAVVAAGLPSIWSTSARRVLWEWFEGELVLEAAWQLEQCVVAEVEPSAFQVTCDSTYTNSLMVAAREPVEPFTTKITVTNGVVTKILGGASVARPRDGGVFTDLGGRWDVHDRFAHWAGKAYPAEFGTACSGEHSMGPECARFTVSHEEEWVWSEW